MRSNIGIISLMVRGGRNMYRTPRSLRAVPVALILLVGAGTGCAPDPAPGAASGPAAAGVDSGVAAPAAQGPGTASEQDGPDAIAGAQWTAADTDVDRPVAGAALLREVRTARHEGFDRIVLEFGDDEVPGYRVAYIDRPVRQCGSGDAVPLAGAAWLSVVVEPANAHTEAGEPTVRERERAPRLPALLEMKVVCDFEAVVEVVAGVAAPERYRTFVLTGPSRLVVDIMHPAAP
jgi:hypothetical protein